jgi:hypothetical protein
MVEEQTKSMLIIKMNIMRRLFLHHPIAFLIIAIIVIAPLESQADTELEIKHIIEYIESSKCTFIRNGKEYNTKEALEHILNKYEYTKRWIKSAEDFIEYTASKSSMSGRPYTVRCDGGEFLSAEWLLKELERFRKKPE